MCIKYYSLLYFTNLAKSRAHGRMINRKEVRGFSLFIRQPPANVRHDNCGSVCMLLCVVSCTKTRCSINSFVEMSGHINLCHSVRWADKKGVRYSPNDGVQSGQHTNRRTRTSCIRCCLLCCVSWLLSSPSIQKHWQFRDQNDQFFLPFSITHL